MPDQLFTDSYVLGPAPTTLACESMTCFGQNIQVPVGTHCPVCSHLAASPVVITEFPCPACGKPQNWQEYAEHFNAKGETLHCTNCGHPGWISLDESIMKAIQFFISKRWVLKPIDIPEYEIDDTSWAAFIGLLFILEAARDVELAKESPDALVTMLNSPIGNNGQGGLLLNTFQRVLRNAWQHPMELLSTHEVFRNQLLGLDEQGNPLPPTAQQLAQIETDFLQLEKEVVAAGSIALGNIARNLAKSIDDFLPLVVQLAQNSTDLLASDAEKPDGLTDIADTLYEKIVWCLTQIGRLSLSGLDELVATTAALLSDRYSQIILDGYAAMQQYRREHRGKIHIDPKFLSLQKQVTQAFAEATDLASSFGDTLVLSKEAQHILAMPVPSEEITNRILVVDKKGSMEDVYEMLDLWFDHHRLSQLSPAYVVNEAVAEGILFKVLYFLSHCQENSPIGEREDDGSNSELNALFDLFVKVFIAMLEDGWTWYTKDDAIAEKIGERLCSVLKKVKNGEPFDEEQLRQNVATFEKLYDLLGDIFVFPVYEDTLCDHSPILKEVHHEWAYW